jgi:TonB-dependent SusC/RagA subfamily outer membrane receptor
MKIKLFLLTFISFLLFFDIAAQKNNNKITITGRVTDLYRSPVSGALIMIDGKNTAAKTGDKGQYKIKVKSSAAVIGVFTTVTGAKEEPINGRTVINFELNKVITLLQGVGTSGVSEEVINEGFGTAKKGNISKPVSKSDVSGNEYSSFSSIYDVLKTVPGVTVSGTSVTVRGVGTTGSSSALFVINGITTSSISGINPSTVKSIEVLKGPAASVYGLQGANGVILIQLKGGN